MKSIGTAEIQLLCLIRGNGLAPLLVNPLGFIT
jgi:hypothetical protein